jgi:hypothetical protein
VYLGGVANVLCFTMHGVYVSGSFYVILCTMDHTAPIPRLVGIMELVCGLLSLYLLHIWYQLLVAETFSEILLLYS